MGCGGYFFLRRRDLMVRQEVFALLFEGTSLLTNSDIHPGIVSFFAANNIIRHRALLVFG
jgi:hypothetical protein